MTGCKISNLLSYKVGSGIFFVILQPPVIYGIYIKNAYRVKRHYAIFRSSKKSFLLFVAVAAALVACGSSGRAAGGMLPTGGLSADTVINAVGADSLSQNGADTDTVCADSAFADADSIPLVRATHAWKKGISDGIDGILDNPLLMTSVAGIVVWDLDDDELLYAHDRYQRLRPASTLKTLTAITALDVLGSDYQFTTRVYADTTASASVPDIYVVGGMDPRLSLSDFASFAKAVREQGLDSVRNVYADQSFKDKKPYGAGWCWDDKTSNPLLLPLTYRGRDNALETLVGQLRKIGVSVERTAGVAHVPDSAVLVGEHHRSLRSVMRPMLKNSDNRCAESVFYAMIHHVYGRGAKAAQGERMIKRLLADAGDGNTVSYDFVDGSGLSLYDYVTADAEVKMLRYAWKNEEIYDVLRPLLPIAGRDGTLRRRMRGTRAAGNVHAKTGTVTGVRSLCGYLTASNGHHIAFAIINQGVSGSDGSARKARNMQDRICELLCSAE